MLAQTGTGLEGWSLGSFAEMLCPARCPFLAMEWPGPRERGYPVTIQLLPDRRLQVVDRGSLCSAPSSCSPHNRSTHPVQQLRMPRFCCSRSLKGMTGIPASLPAWAALPFPFSRRSSQVTLSSAAWACL